MTTICPGCNGPKSKRAQLCASCRRRAISAGVDVVVENISSGQISAFHAIANHVDKLRGVPLGTTKQRIKDEYGIVTLKTLSRVRAADVLDRLDDERSAALNESLERA